VKIEESPNGPKLNLLKPEGTRNQAHAADVTCVLLADDGWLPIVPGTFHFYKTAGDKPVPFVQFDVIGNPGAAWADSQKYRVEVFPTSIGGLAYRVED